MPAETNQRGQAVDPESVLGLLLALLGEPGLSASIATCASLGVDDHDLSSMWDAVCEEFAERSLGPDLEPEFLQASMTLEEAATAMAALLGKDRRERD